MEAAALGDAEEGFDAEKVDPHLVPRRRARPRRSIGDRHS
jgi:hypothetical protein